MLMLNCRVFLIIHLRWFLFFSSNGERLCLREYGGLLQGFRIFIFQYLYSATVCVLWIIRPYIAILTASGYSITPFMASY